MRFSCKLRYHDSLSLKNRYWLTNIIIHHFCFSSRQCITFCASNNLFRASARPACSRSIYLLRLAQTGRVIRLKRKYISPPVPWLSFCWFHTVHVWLLIERNQEASIGVSLSTMCEVETRWLGKFIRVDSMHLKITGEKDDKSCFLRWSKLLDLFGYEQNFTLSNILILILVVNDLSINHLEDVRLNIFSKEFFEDWNLNFLIF